MILGQNSGLYSMLSGFWLKIRVCIRMGQNEER